jgi:hypothetical protein
MNEIDDEDKVLLQKAFTELESANRILRFLSDHFRDKYRLTPGQSVLQSGEITSLFPSATIGKEEMKESGNGVTLSGDKAN